jgi:hypothetical protein
VNCTEDDYSRICVDISKIFSIEKNDLTKYGYEYNSESARKAENIVSLDINNLETLKMLQSEYQSYDIFPNLDTVYIEFPIDNYTSLEIINFPKNIKNFEFDYSFNSEIICMPDTIEKVHLGIRFNQKLTGLPKKLKTLVLSNYFNQELVDLPPTIENLRFGDVFNGSLDCLPTSITHLTLGKNFNRLIDNLPAHITHLTLGENFNQPVNHLPNSITNIIFGKSFNQLIDNLPINITNLTLGENFNQPVNHLPTNISYLTLGENFNQPVNHLPESITNIIFGKSFNQSIDNLPTNLKYLKLDSVFENSLDNLPDSIIELEIYKISPLIPLKKLPNSLLKLTFVYFNRPIGHADCSDISCPKNLPIGLVELVLGGFNYPLNKLPESLRFLTVSTDSDLSLGEIPRGIKNLSLFSSNSDVYNSIPKTVEILTIDLRIINFIVKVNPEIKIVNVINFTPKKNKYLSRIPQEKINLIKKFNNKI